MNSQRIKWTIALLFLLTVAIGCDQKSDPQIEGGDPDSCVDEGGNGKSCPEACKEMNARIIEAYDSLKVSCAEDADCVDLRKLLPNGGCERNGCLFKAVHANADLSSLKADWETLLERQSDRSCLNSPEIVDTNEEGHYLRCVYCDHLSDTCALGTIDDDLIEYDFDNDPICAFRPCHDLIAALNERLGQLQAGTCRTDEDCLLLESMLEPEVCFQRPILAENVTGEFAEIWNRLIAQCPEEAERVLGYDPTCRYQKPEGCAGCRLRHELCVVGQRALEENGERTDCDTAFQP